MLEGISIQPGAPVIRCPICGAGIDCHDAPAVARASGWTELPGVWLCPGCNTKPDVWASIGVEVTPVGDQSIIRVVGIPILHLPHEDAHAHAVSLRSSLAAFVGAAMAAARRG